MPKTSIPIIDPHLHLFNLQKGDYAWLKPNNPPFWQDKYKIHHDFSESDLALDTPFDLQGFVHIEAGFDNQNPWREIDWLEQHCQLPFKSVAFADLVSDSFPQQLQILKQRKSVVGIRHILDDDAYDILSHSLTPKHWSLLQENELSFDAQLPLSDDRAVKQLMGLAAEYPKLKIIINHGGWPTANEQAKQNTWRDNLESLAQHNNVAIKLSGWEMTNRRWQVSDALNIVEQVLKTFSSSRVMLASNFPLCTLTLPYQRLWETYTELSGIENQTLKKLMFENAAKWYKFN